MERTRWMLIVSLLIALGAAAFGQDAPLWMRYPAISPDGSTIAFSYKGDIWSVPAAGGTAVPLTLGVSFEYAPVWSRDGKRIAFASDRYGNFDVFVMPAAGGEARRLTFHSAAEVPSAFTADDRAVLFSARRQQAPADVQFPTRAMTQLYSVPVAGGRVDMALAMPALDATPDSAGRRLIYHDVKGYEDSWRKHHTSAVTRDVWLYDFKAKTYTQLTAFAGEDRNPVFAANDKDFFYLSELDGTFNVYRAPVADPGKAVQLTKFSRNPVRFLTRAQNDLLCFGYDGEIYTLKPGGQPAKVAVRLAVDGRDTLTQVLPVREGLAEATLSPNGKEYAWVFRGEIFVSSLEAGTTKRVTNTPWQERSVNFSPDGRSLVYAAEKDNNWNVYRVSIVRKEEPYFYLSTVLQEEPVVATAAEEFQPAFSPDGKEVAYLEDRVALKVINLESKATRLILPADKNYSYRDGDQYYQWSPDGKWFLVEFGYPERVQNSQVGLVSADGQGELHNLTLSGYGNGAPKWSLDGTMMIWGTTRHGARQQGGGSVSGDVYAMFFTKAAFDRFKLTKEEFALLKEQEEKAKKEAAAKEKDAKKEAGGKDAAEKAPTKDLTFDWANLAERKARLTVHSSPARDWLLSKDGEKLFYLTSFEKGNDLWVQELRTNETKLFAKLNARQAAMELSADGKFIFLLADRKPMKVDAESGKAEPLKMGDEMILDAAGERAYIFDHAWRQLRDKFYDPGLHNVDWDYYYAQYKKFLPFINNNYDFAEMLSEMLGETNASHTGCGYRPQVTGGDETAELGLLVAFDGAGDGVKITEVVEGGPLDTAASQIRAGHVLEKIDGQPLTAGIDYSRLLNRKAGKTTLLSVYDPAAGTRWEETVKPVAAGAMQELLYQRWVKNRRAEVERLSGGKIGYVHVRAMNDPSMRTVFEEALGRHVGTQALIVDTRFNGGGNIHEELSDFLSGRKYFDIIPHGQYIGSEPYDKWTKPSIVVMGEGNYSDAHLFPVAYKLKGVGKTLGMPVPGTGTFVWWEAQIDPTLVFGIPMGGWRTPDGKFCENNQLEPDIRVRNEPGVMSAGRDQQLEAAVAELLKVNSDK
ncbi:MAG TPA: S41 family peptidase [Acidobacteriota bacterium]|nr:S41 family peptidase [Acidobacteriota bacterium]